MNLKTQILLSEFPVDAAPEAFQILFALVSVIDVVRVLPEVTNKKWDAVGAHRITDVVGAQDVKRLLSV